MLEVIPENTVTVSTAEACLVVDSLVGDDLLHFIHSFAALNTDALHHCSSSNLSAHVHTASVDARSQPNIRVLVLRRPKWISFFWVTSTKYYTSETGGYCCIGAGNMRRIQSPGGGTLMREMMSWAPSW